MNCAKSWLLLKNFKDILRHRRLRDLIIIHQVEAAVDIVTPLTLEVAVIAKPTTTTTPAVVAAAENQQLILIHVLIRIQIHQ